MSICLKQKVIIDTDRLFLREMNADDFHALYQVLSDPDIMRDAKVLAESRNDCASKL